MTITRRNRPNLGCRHALAREKRDWPTLRPRNESVFEVGFERQLAAASGNTAETVDSFAPTCGRCDGRH